MKPSQPQQQRHEILAVMFSSSVFVAMVLADALKAAEMSPVYVIFLSVALAGGLSLIVALELLVEHFARPKR